MCIRDRTNLFNIFNKRRAYFPKPFLLSQRTQKPKDPTQFFINNLIIHKLKNKIYKINKDSFMPVKKLRMMPLNLKKKRERDARLSQENKKKVEEKK